MRVALISTPTRTYAPNYVPPLGIMYLAAHLRNVGHTVTIIDVARTRQSNKQTLKELEAFNPDLIAISAIITAYHFVWELVHDIKKSHQDASIVVGGHITLDNVDMLINDVRADYVIQGYGELKLAALVDYLSGKITIKEVPGLSYKRNLELITNPGDPFYKKLDDAPIPAYDLIDMEYYITVSDHYPKLETYLKKNNKPAPPPRSFVVIGARGCTDKCSFCVHEFDRKGFRIHSVVYLVKNIRILYEQYGVRIFFMGEDLFLFNPRYAEEFVEAMNKNFPDAYFQFSTRADYVTLDILHTMKYSNCYAIVYGFESGNNQILNILGKRIDRKVNIRAYKLISVHGITPACSFMVGTMGETKETIEDTIDAIREAGVLEGAVFFTTPYPGSRIYRWCIENNYITDRHAYLEYISNRDAVRLSINLTQYPDYIVKMMKTLVENALEDNRIKINPEYKVPIIRRIFHRRIVPFIYNLYFSSRRTHGETTEYELNKNGTVKLAGET